ncbi:tRNA-anti-like protein [Gemmata sp. SH-PL17]|uniref:OB-fold protein n=1 Tax=Gemmata sp. SH-PL17 TaxID=1630693 RepID=UPI00078CA816|nr:hypothetical protein [Gemmata sp. SH-PL17]AMV30094.1 tRNA-anti-like protein [Gemmata sp. SH-PL17]
MIVLRIVSVVVFVSCCIACGGAGSKSTSTSKEVGAPANKRSEPTGSIENLLAEMRADPEGASEMYKGRRVTVSATVHSADWFDKKSKGPHALLQFNNPTKDTVAAFFGRRQAKEVLALKKGDRATITGTILYGTGKRGEPTTLGLDDCELIESK